MLRTICLSKKLYVVKKTANFSLKSLSEPQTVVKWPYMFEKKAFLLGREHLKLLAYLHKSWAPRWIVQINHYMPGFLTQHFKWPSSQKKSVQTAQRKVLISTILTALEISLKTLRYAIPGTCIYNLWSCLGTFLWSLFFLFKLHYLVLFTTWLLIIFLFQRATAKLRGNYALKLNYIYRYA